MSDPDPVERMKQITDDPIMLKCFMKLTPDERAELIEVVDYAKARYGDLGVGLDMVLDPECTDYKEPDEWDECMVVFEIVIVHADRMKWDEIKKDIFPRLKLMNGRVAIVALDAFFGEKGVSPPDP
jgi:hypothetical protein